MSESPVRNNSRRDTSSKPALSDRNGDGVNRRITPRLRGRKKSALTGFGYHLKTLVNKLDSKDVLYQASDGRTYKRQNGALVQVLKDNGLTIVGRKAIKKYLAEKRKCDHEKALLDPSITYVKGGIDTNEEQI